MRRMTWDEVCARRLARHALLEPSADIVAVASGVCGVHAQVMSAAELSIGVRVAGVTRADVRRALWTERRLVKTYGPRGTVHLYPAGELALWSAAFAEAPVQHGSLPPALRMTDHQVDAVVDAIAAALKDAELTVDELDEHVVDRVGAWAGERVLPAFDARWPRWRVVIATAAHRGALCFGPVRGRRVTYTDPRRWAPGYTPADGPAALADVALRYLRSYGPATPAQFAQWLNMPRPRATALFESLSGALREVDVEGVMAWLPADDDDPPVRAGGLRLLPYFDAYTVGCHPRAIVFPGVAADRALSRGQAGTVPVVLVGGVVAGVWHQRRSGSTLAVTVEMFGRLSAKRRRDLEGEVERLGQIVQAAPTLTIGPVTSRSHL